MSGKVIGSGRLREGGKGVVHRHDFKVHTTGEDWRHTADQTDMAPAIDILAGAFSSPNVQGTLEKLATYFSSIGQGFISIGDGYDQGDYNVGDPSTPSLKAAFDAAFTNTRLQEGGIILVKAGTYVLNETVTLPPGIMVMGENRGTIIIGHTAEQPMFQIQACQESPKIGDVLGVEQFIARPIDGNKFFNLTLVDNLDGYITSGGIPTPTMQTVPMIRCAGGSVLELDQITFMGKIQEGFPVDQRPPISRSIVGYNSPSASIGSTLVVERCFIDGFGVGIEFSPSQAELDFLTVDKCRARTFGRLDSNLTTTNNCFIAMTMCNATITSNYHVSTGVAGTENPENFIAHVGTFTPGAVRPRVIITGNSGGPAGGAHDNAGTSTEFCLMRGFSGQHIGAVAANSWGNHIGSEWYITVSASGATTTDALEGDITGTSALEFVLNNLDDNGTTILLNPGTHIITTAPATVKRFKVIGNKHGANYPVISLTLTGTAPTVFANKTLFLGNYVSGVVFDATSATAYRGIRVHWSEASGSPFRGAVEVKDCIFRDVALVCIDSSASSLDDRISISVENCVFNQSGTFADNFSILLPEANVVRLQDCVFDGKGYVGGIGSWAAGYTGMAGHGSDAEVQILVDNCLLDLTGQTISTTSVLGQDKYFIIDTTIGDVTVSNTKIFAANNQTGLPEPISASIDTSFFAFVNLRARNVRIDNCELNGPAQSFEFDGYNWAMPTLLVSLPQFGAGFWMCNSLISGAALPLQIINSSSYDNSVRLPSNNIYLENCEIKTWNDGYCNTALDIDVFNDPGIIIDAPVPTIMLKNCQFTASSDTALTPFVVNHTNHIGSYYDVGGTVQIYANGWSVHVNDCKVYGLINTTGLSGSFIDHWGGLLINTHNGPVSNGSGNSRTFVSNCDIVVSNDNGNASSTSAALWLTSWHMQVCNNFIGMSNLDSGGSNNVVCAYIENIASGSNLQGLFQNNAFDRIGTALRGGYVIIDSASGAGGLFCDNRFSSVTFDGVSNTALIDDNTATPFWIVERNKNQTTTAAITSSTGVSEIDQTGIGYTAATHDFKPDETTGDQVLRVQTSAGSVTSIWSVDLNSVLPPNTQVVSATSTLSFSGTGTPSGSVTLNLVNATSNDSAAGSVPAGGVITVSAGTVTDYLVNATQRPRVYANLTLAETGASSFYDATLTPIVVTYRW